MSDEISKQNELPKAYDPSTIEQRWAEYWVRERLFDVPSPEHTQDDTKKFTMLLPPPNVTGRLHMGHMLNQAEMDILTRWHRMLGETSLWVPGTDHAGIATQMMVERALKAEGTSRVEMGRTAFTERVWAWKKEYGGAITDQMRRLGASVDWLREYFTMDDGLSVAVKEAFVRLYEQGLIYRGAYIVNWDPQIQTAVSDLEVENEERMGKLYHVRYPLADGTGSIVIATTRPETMLGDVAVVVNPEDERYTALVGKIVALPLTGREIPILADEWAKPEFGTGAVKVTPAHDPNDFAIGQRHGLPQLTIFDTHAQVALSGSPYDGMERFAAREKIVADLDALGLLVEVKDHPMTVPVSQRSGVVIEPRLSMQWFISVNKTPEGGGDSIAAKAIAAVREKHITFTPEMYSKTYFEWMENIHDWCISRQLWWGHRIPAWHCEKGHITVARETPEACSTCGSAALTQETDVLDTWFSSGLLPFTVFGWPGEQGTGIRDKGTALTPDLAAFYPTELLVTGFDILFFWVARMIMLGCHFMIDVPMPDGSARTLKDSVPFKDVYIHGLVRDANREKMSKTKGNVINPIDIIERFGTDAVRFTLASMASPGTDIAFSEARTEGYRAFANKIWNSARFLFQNVEKAKEAGISVDAKALKAALLNTATSRLEGKWIVARLAATSAIVDEALKKYRFDEAANAIYQFFWGDFCDWYLEIVKLRLNFDEGADKAATAAALTTLLAVFEGALRLLSPLMPFITEEIWQAFWPQIGLEVPLKSIALAEYPVGLQKAAGDLTRPEAQMMHIQHLIVAVRSQRKEFGIPEKEGLHILVLSSNLIGNASDDPRVGNVLTENQDIIKRLARVSLIEDVNLGERTEKFRHLSWKFAGACEVALVYERQIDVPTEREKLTKEMAKLRKGLDAAEKQLGNAGFMARAPEHIVTGLREQFAETSMLYEKAKAALEALPEA